MVKSGGRRLSTAPSMRLPEAGRIDQHERHRSSCYWRHTHILTQSRPATSALLRQAGDTSGRNQSGSPGRLSAVIAETCLLTSGLSRTMPPLKSVWMGPGATTFALMRRGLDLLAYRPNPLTHEGAFAVKSPSHFPMMRSVAISR